MDNKILVINRGSCSVGYSIPEMSVNRTFRPLGQPGDRMNISKEELKALNYTHGGRIIIEKYLMFDEDFARGLGLDVEPEYNYTIEDVKKLLTSGTLEQLEDCLEFAPEGVLDLVQKEAISMRLDSHQKRELISKKLGINLDSMIKNDIIIKSAEQNTNNENKAVSTSKKQGETVKTRKSTPVNSKPILTK